MYPFRQWLPAGKVEPSKISQGDSRAPARSPFHRTFKPVASTCATDAEVLGTSIASLSTALEALREITRGVFPAQLARSGLRMALGSLLTRTPSTPRL